MFARPLRTYRLAPAVLFITLIGLWLAGRGPVSPVAAQGTLPGTVPGTVPSTATPTATPAPTSRPTRVPLRPRKPTPVPDTASVDRDARPGLVRVGPAALVTLLGDVQSDGLYATTDAGTLVGSRDAGNSWSLIAQDPVSDAFLVSPADGEILYSGERGNCVETQPSPAFLTSSDGARSWTAVPLAAGLLPLLGHPVDADILLAADCELPFLSMNGGRTWAAKPDQSRAHLWESYVATHAAAASQVNAATAADGHWNYLFVAGAASNGSGVVAYSGDMGDTWERITPRMNPAPGAIHALLADRLVAGRLWFVDDSGVWYTEDFGATWEILRSGLGSVLDGAVDEDEDAGGLPALRTLALAADDTLYLGTAQGLYRLAPDATRWRAVTDGFFGRAPVTALLILDADPETLWVTTEEGVYRYPRRSGQ